MYGIESKVEGGGAIFGFEFFRNDLAISTNLDGKEPGNGFGKFCILITIFPSPPI